MGDQLVRCPKCEGKLKPGEENLLRIHSHLDKRRRVRCGGDSVSVQVRVRIAFRTREGRRPLGTDQEANNLYLSRCALCCRLHLCRRRAARTINGERTSLRGSALSLVVDWSPPVQSTVRSFRRPPCWHTDSCSPFYVWIVGQVITNRGLKRSSPPPSESHQRPQKRQRQLEEDPQPASPPLPDQLNGVTTPSPLIEAVLTEPGLTIIHVVRTFFSLFWRSADRCVWHNEARGTFGDHGVSAPLVSPHWPR